MTWYCPYCGEATKVMCGEIICKSCKELKEKGKKLKEIFSVGKYKIKEENLK